MRRVFAQNPPCGSLARCSREASSLLTLTPLVFIHSMAEGDYGNLQPRQRVVSRRCSTLEHMWVLTNRNSFKILVEHEQGLFDLLEPLLLELRSCGVGVIRAQREERH